LIPEKPTRTRAFEEDVDQNAAKLALIRVTLAAFSDNNNRAAVSSEMLKES
jgi:hypothetical protein